MLGACSTFAKTSVKTNSPQLCKVCLPNKRRPVAPFSAAKFQCYCISWRDVAGKGCFLQGGLSKDNLWGFFFKWKATKGISHGPAAGSDAHVEQHLCLASTWVRSALQRVFWKGLPSAVWQAAVAGCPSRTDDNRHENTVWLSVYSEGLVASLDMDKCNKT